MTHQTDFFSESEFDALLDALKQAAMAELFTQLLPVLEQHKFELWHALQGISSYVHEEGFNPELVRLLEEAASFAEQNPQAQENA